MNTFGRLRSATTLLSSLLFCAVAFANTNASTHATQTPVTNTNPVSGVVNTTGNVISGTEKATTGVVGGVIKDTGNVINGVTTTTSHVLTGTNANQPTTQTYTPNKTQ